MSIIRNMMAFLTGAGYRQAGLQGDGPATRNFRSAVPVTLDTAMALSAVFACVKLYAETIGTMPIYVYDIDPNTGKKTKNITHPVAILLNNKINRWQTKSQYFETLAYQLSAMGNDYSLIQRNGRKEIIGLIPLMTKQMEVRLMDSGDIEYTYRDGRTQTKYSSDQIWHNKLFGNGIIGLSPLEYAKNAIGIGLGAEESTTKIYQNGGKPSGILSIEKVLTPEQREKIRDNNAELQEGTNNRLFILEAGMKYQQVSLSPQDIELLSSRKFQVEDIARFYGVPSVLINDASTTTAWGTGIDSIIQGWYKLGLKPYLTKYEENMKVTFLNSTERQTMEICFDLDALLQPSFAERVKTYKEAIMSAQMTPNYVRGEEGQEPMEGGNSLYMQQQMVPIEMLKDIDRTKTNTTNNNNGGQYAEDKA